MPGFAPIAALPLSAVGAALITVSAQMAASGSIIFSASPLAGAFIPITASGSFAFSGSPAMITEQAISVTIPLQFTAEADLRTAGRPFEVFALPQSFTVRAILADYTVKAVPRSYTVRAKR